MKEARMAIIKMVEDGKITAEEAVNLLEAASKTAEGSKKHFEGSAEWQNNLEDKIKQFSKNLEEMAKDLGKRLENTGKDIEPKVRKVAQTIINKTTECVDEIAVQFKKDEECCGEDSCCCGEEKTEQKEASCCGDTEENSENREN